MSNIINSYVVVDANDNATMELLYEERFNNKTGDINAKTFIKFYVGTDVVGSISKFNDNKPIMFGQKTEEYARLFRLTV